MHSPHYPDGFYNPDPRRLPGSCVPVVATAGQGPLALIVPVDDSQEPSGPRHIGSELLCLAAQFPIRRHDCHLTGGIGADRKDGIITAA